MFLHIYKCFNLNLLLIKITAFNFRAFVILYNTNDMQLTKKTAVSIISLLA